jgi:hypothetical protein
MEEMKGIQIKTGGSDHYLELLYMFDDNVYREPSMFQNELTSDALLNPIVTRRNRDEIRTKAVCY